MWTILSKQKISLDSTLRVRLFQGECFTSLNPLYLQPVLDEIRQNLEEQFHQSWEGLRSIHFSNTPQDIWRVRQNLHQSWSNPIWRKNLKEQISFLIPFQEFYWVTRPTLRICIPNGKNVSELKNAYSLHRDTWYGYPSSTINVWIPLHHVQSCETFEMYPQCFDQFIPNSSHLFDWKTWRDSPNIAHYPTAHTSETPKDKGMPLSIEGVQDQLFIFSAQHLHQTTPYTHPQTRFSLDFRIILESDILKNRGAPTKDNASLLLPRGCWEE